MNAAREELLIKSWLSHDARWFNAVAREFGLDAANRLNQRAAREAGRVEAQRARRHIGIDEVKSAEDCVRALASLKGCLKAQGLECAHRVRIQAGGAA